MAKDEDEAVLEELRESVYLTPVQKAALARLLNWKRARTPRRWDALHEIEVRAIGPRRLVEEELDEAGPTGEVERNELLGPCGAS